jgi:hypothetical protein
MEIRIMKLFHAQIIVPIAILFIFTSGLLALTGYGTSAPVVNDTVDPSLSILEPNGGEEWYIGDTNDITWAASDTNLSPNGIWLWYSLNGGADYISIAEGITNSGSYPWEIPAEQSYNAKVRVKAVDSFGNFTQTAIAAAFSITYVPPAEPQGVNIDISNEVDAAITWQAVTQTIYGTPITPDGYIILYNESPYESDEHFYYFLAMTTGLSYTHQYVARFREQMFYSIIAFKDYDRSLAAILAPALANPKLKLSLADIKTRLRLAKGGAE